MQDLDITYDADLARFTSWRVGGPAEKLFRPDSIQTLSRYLAACPQDEAITWLGLGSNVLIRDGGIKGTVIITQGMLSGLEHCEPNLIRAEAGVTCAKVAKFCTKQGLTGAEFFAGIPGTVGGALAMNAGAFGGETWESVDRVEVIDRSGKHYIRGKESFNVGYRSVEGLHNEWFVAGYFSLMPGDSSASEKAVKALLRKRSDTQPIGIPNGGSVFRNPPNQFAAELIESCGLKGHRVGRACVSEKHANFILNEGGATAKDIETLINWVANEVEQKRGVRLEPEVRVIGEEMSTHESN